MPDVAEPPVKPAESTSPTPPPKPPEKRSLFEEHFGGRKEKKSTEPKLEAKADEKAAKPADKPAEEEKKAAEPTKPKSKKAETAPVTTPEPVDYDRMGKAIGDGVSTALDQREKQKQAQPPDLDPEDQSKLTEYAKLEKKFPEIYNGLGQRYVKSLKQADAYEAKWLNEHPGEDFDENAAEHDAFFKGLGIVVDPAHIKSLERDELIEEAATKAAKKFEPELNELRAEKKLAQELPKILVAKSSLTRKFLSELGDDYKSVLDQKGNVVLEEVDRIGSSDPVKAVGLDFARRVWEVADNLHRLIRNLPPLPIEDTVPEASPKAIDNYINKLEWRLRSEEKMWNGKRFATIAEWDVMTSSERARHWRLEEDYIKNYYLQDQIEDAKKAMAFEEERLGKFAQARGYVKPQAEKSSERPHIQTTKEVDKTPDPQPSPPGTIEPRMTLPPGQNPGSNGSATRRFQSLFGGR